MKNHKTGSPDEADLIDYLRVIYKYRILISAIVLTVMATTGITVYLGPIRYEASATFFPMSPKEYYGAEPETLIPKQRLNIEDLIVSVLESRNMADRVVKQLNLQDIWKEKLFSGARGRLNKATKVSVEKRGLIKFTVVTESPSLAADIANAYVDNLDEFNREYGLAAEKKIVQVIDRAVVPEQRMPRGLIRKTLSGALASLIMAIFLAFFIEFVRGLDIRNSLKNIAR